MRAEVVALAMSSGIYIRELGNSSLEEPSAHTRTRLGERLGLMGIYNRGSECWPRGSTVDIRIYI